jgi:hypothetical protein
VFKKERYEQTGLVARGKRRGENPFPGIEGGIIMKKNTNDISTRERR